MAIQDFTAGQILTAAQMDSLQANDYNWTVSTKTDSYTLVAADKGTRVVMNKATATTITVNTSLFSAGDTLFIQNIGAGTCTVTAGTATVTTAGSLALAQWGGGTLYFTSASAAIFFSGGGGTGYGSFSGGTSSTVTVGGVDYTLLTFTSSGTLTCVKAGFVDYLMVGGGAGCAFKTSTSAVGAGGGAGQVTSGSIYLAANSTITIGAGSATGNFTGGKRSATDTTATVGTGYQTIYALGAVNASSAGDGSGDAWQVCTTSGAVAGATNSTGINNALYGYKGGNGNTADSGGGGGGFGGAGATGVGATTGGVGGAGYDISVFIGGSTAFRATGGGGGGTVAGGAGGNSSACSNAGSTNTTPGSGAANTGAGGGAGVGTPSTGLGGSGIAYFRFR